ncbi:prohibitin family protein [Nitrospirillum amazonense]|uniref:prohibitin family protein n=1 Tax=Nitrospirillum amazonense TaxID=28077 RepID=UPI00241266E8|nr:prohibitin family protein [Nitrospirillum amazonense]MDG3444620.1 prohibitin family protein [Nitrospirillum amazonense]
MNFNLTPLYRYGSALLIGLVLLVRAWVTVPTGSVGILRTNGAATKVLGPGLHLKIPIFQDVVRLSVQSEIDNWDKLQAYSKDQQPVDAHISIQTRIDPDTALDLYRQFGTAIRARIVLPQSEAAFKEIFGQYSAVSIVQDRTRLGHDLMERAQQEIKTPGIVVEAVNLQNIDFSDAYEHSIEQRMLAEVEVAKLQQNAAREQVQAQIVVTQAKGQADAKIAEAEAEAKAIKLRGDAEAAAIAARGQALRDNPALVSLTAAERWNGVLPTTMVPGGSTPFVQLK